MLVGPGQGHVAEQDRGAGAEPRRVAVQAAAGVPGGAADVHGGPAAAGRGVVHEVVVHQRAAWTSSRAAHGAQHRGGVVEAAGGPPAPARERGTQPLAAGEDESCEVVDGAGVLLGDVRALGAPAGEVVGQVVRIHGQDKAVLIGSWGDNTSTSNLQRVTVHHTWFYDTCQRNPRAVRYSQVHVYNNYLHGWTGVGMAAANWAQLASEARDPRRDAHQRDHDAAEPVHRHPCPRRGLRAGHRRPAAQPRHVAGVRRPDLVFNPSATYQAAVTAAGTALQNDITAYSGVSPVVPRDGAWRLLP